MRHFGADYGCTMPVCGSERLFSAPRVEWQNPRLRTGERWNRTPCPSWSELGFAVLQRPKVGARMPYLKKKNKVRQKFSVRGHLSQSPSPAGGGAPVGTRSKPQCLYVFPLQSLNDAPHCLLGHTVGHSDRAERTTCSEHTDCSRHRETAELIGTLARFSWK